MIDWKRMASPQQDGYDSRMILYMAANTSPCKGNEVAGEYGLCFGGKVKVTYFCNKVMAPPRYTDAPLDHPNLAQAQSLLKCWPEMYSQLEMLLKLIHPFWDTTITEDFKDIFIGSSSYSASLPFGHICATVDNAVGLAQALVHETAHHKLRAMGILEKEAERLLVNPAGEGYYSPMDKKKRCSMTVLFHDFYTFAHLVAFNLNLLKHDEDGERRDLILQVLAKNLTRVEFGYRQVLDNIKTDREGEEFCRSVLEWVKGLMDEGIDLLRETRYRQYC